LTSVDIYIASSPREDEKPVSMDAGKLSFLLNNTKTRKQGTILFDDIPKIRRRIWLNKNKRALPEQLSCERNLDSLLKKSQEKRASLFFIEGAE
jgi:hypothetical protein